jgi:hypothetical protein
MMNKSRIVLLSAITMAMTTSINNSTNASSNSSGFNFSGSTYNYGAYPVSKRKGKIKAKKRAKA